MGAFGLPSVRQVAAAVLVIAAGLIGIVVLSLPEAKRGDRTRRGGRS
jgi:hypothetical protein